MTPDTTADPHADLTVRAGGAPLESAKAALILVHGRGATAEDILTLGDALQLHDHAWLAPQASGHAWYPRSFLAPMEENEPWLSSALAALGRVIREARDAGVADDRVIIAGFSQGACLASEWAARNTARFGGLLVFSGGLIGPDNTPRDYPGDFGGTPVFLGCSDRDPHIPEPRVRETARVLRRMGAEVQLKIYPGMPHTVIPDEIERARRVLRSGNGEEGQGGPEP